jgi:hypothetical protein
MSPRRLALALGALLLTAAAGEAAPDPATQAQRDFILRHYFQGPSETSGWGQAAARNPAARDGRMLGPFRPAYFSLQGERRRGDRTTAQLAALDLHVKPTRSMVLVAGREAGLARRYDGIPRWLWLEPGKQVISFVTPDGETIRKTFELQAGSVTNLEVVLD